MRKVVPLLLIAIVLCTERVSAQRDTVMAYMKNFVAAPWLPSAAKITSSKDSADFIRMVSSPDISTDKLAFPVNDYYLNGNPKLQGYSNNGFVEAQLQGACIEYFPNGKRKCISNYDKGRLSGDITKYFPNGQFYLSGVYKKDTLIINKCSDSTGRVLAEDGNGTLVLYSDGFKNMIGSGPIKGGLKDGIWKGALNDTLSYDATYKNGNVIAGTSYAKSGNKYLFNKEYTAPDFAGGLNKLGSYLAKNIRYPSEALYKNIQGIAYITFLVDRKGFLNDIHPVQGNEMLAEEALRVVRLSPPWQPATSYGITVEVIHTVPISFSIARE
ncbi:hypothetical protein DIU31_009965 [Mucilaginibacter rubeus]|uniref:TonB C-terminal domain-containing protein n=3 Tax=Mucilaginibacter rubeus TaxID=2027860 RepID=A0AAE6JE05_9SPHI|nr:hypothetical protein DIU31_009965 [Mucilaginibacter rubeus]QEM16431.1 hypothetical protein DIU38_010065 [Mucilaginibacter gossypii]